MWRILVALSLQFSENLKTLDDGFEIPWMLLNEFKVQMRENRTTYAYDEDKLIKYFPVKNSALIQNDNKYFNFYIKPSHDPEPITVKWTLLARDFSKTGELKIIKEPIITDRLKIKWVDSIDKVQKTFSKIIELVTV